MTNLVYPSDLYDLALIQWKNSIYKGEEIPSFPKKEIFKKLVDVIYHASFLTEEQRRIWFRVVYISKDEIKKEAQRPVREIRVIEFKQARNFTIGELVKLAPAADPIQVLIGVYQAKSLEELRIWGLIETGTSFWEFTRHESFFGCAPPNALTLSTKKAGQIVFSRSGLILLRLDQGKIEKPSRAVFDKGPIADFLKKGKRNVIDESKKRNITIFGEQYLGSIYAQFIERILDKIREKFHGGTLIIVPEEIKPGDTRLKDRIVIKYLCDFNALDPLIDKIEKSSNYRHSMETVRKQKVLAKDVRECIDAVEDRQTAERRLTATASFISSLSAVDGAVVMNENLQLLGFGAEIIAISPSLKKIKVITDFEKNTGEYRDIELFGTRHRSAFRFCSSFENAIAAIVSQDGGIKLAKRVGSDVLFWPNISSPSLGI